MTRDTDHPLVKMLAGGDRRSIGRADAVVAQLRRDPAGFPAVMRGLVHPDPVIRMRCADVAEKLSRERPELLAPFKGFLLDEVSGVAQQELHWHLAQMLPRLEFSLQERERVVSLLKGWLAETSRIVVAESMQALAELAKDDERLRGEVQPLLQRLSDNGSPAVRARGRKLLKRLH